MSIEPRTHEEVIKLVKEKIPQFARVVSMSITNKNEQGFPPVIIEQDTHATDYSEAGCELLGLTIKYAGLFGVPVLVRGRNGEQAELTAAAAAKKEETKSE